MGIIFEPGNLRSDAYPEADTSLTGIVRHIAYVVERIGVDHVAFGSDFDGAQMPQPLGDASGLPGLMDVLQEAGYGEEALEKIAYRNWLRVLRRCWER